MKNLFIIAILIFYVTQVSAQNYDSYTPYGHPPPVSYNSQRTPQYVQNIENNGPQVDMRRNMERMNRQIEYTNTIRNYELIYSDTYRK